MPGIPAEHTVHEPSLVELAVQLDRVVAPGTHLAVQPGDREEHEQVHQCDEVQERARDRGADDVGHRVQSR